MTRISVAFTLLCILCGITSSFAFVFEDCGSDLGKVNELTISSCDTSGERCEIPRGKEINVSLKFTPNKDVSDVIVQAFGVLLDVPVPLPMKEPNVCKDPKTGLTCPLKKDQEAVYKNSFTVEKKVPALSLDIVCEFRNEKDDKILCIKFPAKVI